MASHEFINGNENALKDYISNNQDSQLKMAAYKKMVFHYADTKQMGKELLAYGEMLSIFPDDPSALNSYAWRMAEIETNLEDALLKARKAVLLSWDNPDRQAGIIDTEAEVLWKLKRYDEAIEAIDKAIAIVPDNKYFRDQREKFIESRETASQSA